MFGYLLINIIGIIIFIGVTFAIFKRKRKTLIGNLS